MKGLIYKELLAVVKHYRTYFLMCLIFIAASWFDPENLFYSLYPSILIGSVLVGLIALDENSKWNLTCGFLPFTQEMLVGTRYLVGMLLTGAVFLLVVGGQAVRMLIRGSLNWGDLSMLAVLTVSTGLVMPGLMLPFIYKFGVEKGRLAYLLALGGGAGTLAYFGTNGQMARMRFEFPVWIVAVAAAAVYGISCLISVGVCKRKTV